MYEWIGGSQKVKIIAGEHAGELGTVESEIHRRYSRSPRTYRVRINGYPKPGGWNGLVCMGGDMLEAIKE